VPVAVRLQGSGPHHVDLSTGVLLQQSSLNPVEAQTLYNVVEDLAWT
jgi:hypothetical protein